MSFKSVLDSIDPFVKLRAKSKLDSMREQILWKNFCKSVINCQQNSVQTNCEISEKCFNDSKSADFEQQLNVCLNSDFGTYVDNNCDQSQHSDQLSDISAPKTTQDLIPDDFKIKLNYLEIQLKNSLKFESILRKKYSNINNLNKNSEKSTKCSKLKSIKPKTNKIVAKTETNSEIDEQLDEDLVLNKLINELIIDLFDSEFDKLLMNLLSD